jgi:hypothetical protein
VKLYEVFERAIERLHTAGRIEVCSPPNMWTCEAIFRVLETHYKSPMALWDAFDKAKAYLKGFGLDPNSANCFVEFETPHHPYLTPKSQQARALWLTWAAMIAREEDV